MNSDLENLLELLNIGYVESVKEVREKLRPKKGVFSFLRKSVDLKEEIRATTWLETYREFLPLMQTCNDEDEILTLIFAGLIESFSLMKQIRDDMTVEMWVAAGRNGGYALILMRFHESLCMLRGENYSLRRKQYLLDFLSGKIEADDLPLF